MKLQLSNTTPVQILIKSLPQVILPELKNIIADYLRKWAKFKTLEGHADLSSIAFSSDNKYLYSGSDDKNIKIWHYEGID